MAVLPIQGRHPTRSAHFIQAGLPEAHEGWNTFGLVLRGVGHLEGALEKFLQAILSQENFYPAHTNAALVLQELGRIDEAIPHFRRAVELSPNSCTARTSLGLALLLCEQYKEALPHFQEAARLSPDVAVVHHNLGNSLRLLGLNSEARASYLKAIRLDPSLTLSHVHIGLTLRLEGSSGDALRWYKLAVEMEPDNPDIWEELADLYLKRDEPGEAVTCWQRILELSPMDPAKARLGLGWALQEDGRTEEALEHYLIVRNSQPDSAQAHFALSGAYQEMGRMTEAEAEVHEAIRLQPRFAAAHARLATMAQKKLDKEDLQAIESLLADRQVGQGPRARLLFAIAHVYDARGDYSRAACCLREANELTLQSRRAEGLVYDPEEHTQFVDRLIAAFDHGFFRRTAGLGLGSRRPVFIVGLPRSGTTLVEQILASHPHIYGAGERLFGRRTFEVISSVVCPGKTPCECIASLDEYSLKRLGGEYLGKLNALDSGRYERIVDKLPENYIYVGLLSAIFPNAVFVHCRRDLRDVAVSCWMSDFRGVRWANDVRHIGSRFQQYCRLMDHWRRVSTATILDADYEDTVADLEGVARRLIDRCGLDWDPACLEYHRTQRVVQTASLAQVRQPIYKSSVARWKNYEDDLADLFAMLTHVRFGNEENEISADTLRNYLRT